MKTLGKSVLFVGSLLAATSLFAQNNAHKHEGANELDMHKGMAMSHENMEKMHKKMMEMKKEILAIKSEQDPEKQKRMMHKHRRSMIKIMQIMHRGMEDKPIQKQIAMAEHHLQMMKKMMPEMKDKSQKHSH
jgi:hypothetical protein